MKGGALAENRNHTDPVQHATLEVALLFPERSVRLGSCLYAPAPQSRQASGTKAEQRNTARLGNFVQKTSNLATRKGSRVDIQVGSTGIESRQEGKPCAIHASSIVINKVCIISSGVQQVERLRIAS